MSKYSVSWHLRLISNGENLVNLIRTSYLDKLKTNCEVEVYIHAFLPSERENMGDKLQGTRHCTFGKSCVGARTSLDEKRNIVTPTENRNPITRSSIRWAGHYTDCVIPDVFSYHMQNCSHAVWQNGGRLTRTASSLYGNHQLTSLTGSVNSWTKASCLVTSVITREHSW
jgi:hypothetical protein